MKTITAIAALTALLALTPARADTQPTFAIEMGPIWSPFLDKCAADVIRYNESYSIADALTFCKTLAEIEQ